MSGKYLVERDVWVCSIPEIPDIPERGNSSDECVVGGAWEKASCGWSTKSKRKHIWKWDHRGGQG